MNEVISGIKTSQLAVLKAHPSWPLALEILETLKKNRFEAVLAGGCVRDAILERPPKDLDVATSAEPSRVEALFSRTVAVGKSFGVIRVHGGDTPNHSQKGSPTQEVEVASFRFDGKYIDGRRPSSIKFATAPEDAQRRDFTVNALFYDPLENRLFDFVGGVKDLTLRRICCVGVPKERFQEDHLRLIRAVRFSAELDFGIESETWKAILDLSHLIETVSSERIRDELLKILKCENPSLGVRTLQKSGLLKVMDPEFNKVFDQNTRLPSFQGSENSEKPERKSEKKSEKKPEAQIWASFFSFLGKRVLDSDFLEAQMKRYRLSRETQRFIQKCLYYLYSLDEIGVWREGKKLMCYYEPEFQWALEYGKSCFSVHLGWVNELRQLIHTRGFEAGLPTRILRGNDLPEEIPENRRKEVLDLAYQEQLERGWVTREEAQAWMKGYPA